MLYKYNTLQFDAARNIFVANIEKLLLLECDHIYICVIYMGTEEPKSKILLNDVGLC